MKKRKRLPKSIRKYIRKEKSRIRREVLDLEEQQRQIEEIYRKLRDLSYLGSDSTQSLPKRE